ncbi:hypothetical protein [Metaclostridioides mangenotii]|uniref:hypothetical protein n=1 Tax=Metaclostridioides mangenotii TaxID=1540 RepID=UPI0004B323DB|nr:hypothetical protein [Clostridioides mangenotii]
MEKIIIFLLFINGLIIALNRALRNVNKLLDNYIDLREKIGKIKEHPSDSSDVPEENF